MTFFEGVLTIPPRLWLRLGQFARDGLYFESPGTQTLSPSAVGHTLMRLRRQAVGSPQWECVRGEVASWKAAMWENVWLAGL